LREGGVADDRVGVSVKDRASEVGIAYRPPFAGIPFGEVLFLDRDRVEERGVA
jgi:hypothetical protein